MGYYFIMTLGRALLRKIHRLNNSNLWMGGLWSPLDKCFIDVRDKTLVVKSIYGVELVGLDIVEQVDDLDKVIEKYIEDHRFSANFDIITISRLVDIKEFLDQNIDKLWSKHIDIDVDYNLFQEITNNVLFSIDMKGKVYSGVSVEADVRTNLTNFIKKHIYRIILIEYSGMIIPIYYKNTSDFEFVAKVNMGLSYYDDLFIKSIETSLNNGPSRTYVYKGWSTIDKIVRDYAEQCGVDVIDMSYKLNGLYDFRHKLEAMSVENVNFWNNVFREADDVANKVVDNLLQDKQITERIEFIIELTKRFK